MDITSDSFSRIFPWAISLSAGFPLALVVLGELGLYADRAGWPAASTIRGVRLLVAPALVLMLFVRFILERPSDDAVTQISKTIFWIAVLYQSLAFINQVVFVSAKPGSRQSRVPSLFRDIARFILVGIGAALIYSDVWGKEIGAAWTALGLGSVVIGLALQEPLGNTVSGLILLAERPLALGDWLSTTDGITGKVVEINWRAVHIETLSHELKIIPNSSLYRGSFSNLSRPNLIRSETVELSFSCDIPPTRVKKTLLDLLQSIPVILQKPAPEVALEKYGGAAIIYRVRFSVARQEDIPYARDDFLTHVWYVSRRERFNAPDQHEPQISPLSPVDLLQTIPRFKVSDSLKQELAPKTVFLLYGKGERIVSDGGPLNGLYVLLVGNAVLSIHDAAGIEHEIGRVGPGEFFGESSIIAGQPSEFAVTAADDVELLSIHTDALHRLLDSVPRLAREIGYILDIRRKAVQGIRSLHRNTDGIALSDLQLDAPPEN